LYPREITNIERTCLFLILPENKPGYNLYRKKIAGMLVIGDGKFGEGNYILGKNDPDPDLSFPSTPVFALGTLYNGTEKFDVIIHEETEDKIEIWFDKDINEITDTSFNVKSYSYWIPGMNSPFSDSKVREIIIKPNENNKKYLQTKKTKLNHMLD